MEKKIRVSDLRPLAPFCESFSFAGEDYAFSHIVSEGNHYRSPEMVKFEGVTITLLIRGCMEVAVNADKMRMLPMSVLVTNPSDIVSTRGVDFPLETFNLFFGREFISSMNFDLKILSPAYHINAERVLPITSAQCRQLCDYMKLLYRCASDNAYVTDDDDHLRLISRSIGINLAVSMLYQIAYITESRNKSLDVKTERAGVSHRRTSYAVDFMHLLEEYFMTDRTVKFYADKLCITPKYLSIIVKAETGHSAATLIDHYVINEAKNLLKFSTLSVQQIAYKMNFSNQSAFGKYFKHLTGVSPTEYRNS